MENAKDIISTIFDGRIEEIASLRDNEVKELQDVHFNYPLNYVSISDEEIASTGNVTVDVI